MRSLVSRSWRLTSRVPKRFWSSQEPEKVVPFGSNLEELQLHRGPGVRVVIEGYYDDGFQIYGARHAGPVALLPNFATRWLNVSKPEEITYESLLLFVMAEPKIDILLIGTGQRTEFIHPDLREKMRQHNIVIEAMASDKALATFNILAEEARNVGAALLTQNCTAWRDH